MSHTEGRSSLLISPILLSAFGARSFLQILLQIFTQSGGKHKGLKAISDSLLVVFGVSDVKFGVGFIVVFSAQESDA
jgi:hypothetical protein